MKSNVVSISAAKRRQGKWERNGGRQQLKAVRKCRKLIQEIDRMQDEFFGTVMTASEHRAVSKMIDTWEDERRDAVWLFTRGVILRDKDGGWPGTKWAELKEGWRRRYVSTSK